MLYKIRGIEICINLDPGFYLFDELSATGKTYLYKLLMEVQLTGKSVYPVTLNTWVRYKDNIIFDINKNKYELILLDRFGMYANDAYNLVKSINIDNTVVLLESKTTLGGSEIQVYPCFIEYSTDKVVVHE